MRRRARRPRRVLRPPLGSSGAAQPSSRPGKPHSYPQNANPTKIATGFIWPARLASQGVTEWFLVPFFVIDEAVGRIKDGSITDYVYDPKAAKLVKAGEVTSKERA